MRPTIAALLVAPLLLASLLATPAPAAQDGRSVWTVFNTVEAEVHDNYAVVRVIADIGNRGPDPEFPFQVLLPTDAYVTGLSVERDGELWEARVEDRDAAREEYEGQKEQENTAALVEKTRGTQRFAFLVNVAEFQSVRATLTYEVLLAADQGVFTLPLEAPVSGFGEDLGAAFHVAVHHTDGVTSAWSEPAVTPQAVEGSRELAYSVGPRASDAPTPFVVHYQLPPTPDGGSLAVAGDRSGGVFAHRFRAPADDAGLPLDMVLVMDTSGSMSGLKIVQLRDAASQVVGRLDADDRIAIVPFDSQADTSWGGLRPADAANRTAAVEEVLSFFAAGGTNIGDGLARGWSALGEPEPERSRILVFLTDGQATSGTTGRDALLAETRGYDDGVRLFGLAFGEDADWGLVSALARQHGGTAHLVASGAGAEVDLRTFMAALTTPVLEDVSIRYDGDVTPYRHGAPVLFSGSELLVVGTYADRDAVSGNVTGRSADGPRTYAFSEPVGTDAPEWLPRLVAAATIRHHEELIHAEGSRPEWVETIRSLALEFGFVTDHTSLVLATETDEPVARDMEDREAEPSRPTDPEAPREPGDGGGQVGLDRDGEGSQTPLPLWSVPLALLVAAVAWRRR